MNSFALRKDKKDQLKDLITPCDLWLASAKNETGVCSTIPIESLTESQSLALEFFATMFLIFVVCSAWDVRNADKADSIPLKFAATITVISIIVGPLTGASMNPVRSLAPAVVNGVWIQHWIYWVGPLSSAFITTCFYQFVFNPKQQSQLENAEEVPLTGVASTENKNLRDVRLTSVTTDIKQSAEIQPK